MTVFLEPYINFDGNTEEAFGFYQTVFQADEPYFMRFSEIPSDDDMLTDPQVKQMNPEAIMHASLKLGQTSLMGSDVIPGQYVKPAGVQLSWSSDDPAEVERVWQAFVAKGSQVIMPLAETFWAKQFGMLKDPYHVEWMIQFYDPTEM